MQISAPVVSRLALLAAAVSISCNACLDLSLIPLEVAEAQVPGLEVPQLSQILGALAFSRRVSKQETSRAPRSCRSSPPKFAQQLTFDRLVRVLHHRCWSATSKIRVRVRRSSKAPAVPHQLPSTRKAIGGLRLISLLWAPLMACDPC